MKHATALSIAAAIGLCAGLVYGGEPSERVSLSRGVAPLSQFGQAEPLNAQWARALRGRTTEEERIRSGQIPRGKRRAVYAASRAQGGPGNGGGVGSAWPLSGGATMGGQ
jgi:hypothetical protein